MELIGIDLTADWTQWLELVVLLYKEDKLKHLKPTPRLVRTGKAVLHCFVERLSAHLQVIKGRARHVQQRGCDSLLNELQGTSKGLVQA